MISTCVLLITVFIECYRPEAVLLSRYDERPTIGTIWYQLEVNESVTQAQVANADMLVAVADCDHIGRNDIWLRDGNNSHSEWQRALAFDCAERGDPIAQNFMKHIAYEVDYWTAKSWGFTGLHAWPGFKLVRCDDCRWAL